MFGIGKDGLQKALEEARKKLQALTQELKEAGIELPEVYEGRIQEGKTIKVAIFGEYNVGKSSLINALLGENLSKVGNLPTTDRIIEYTYSKERESKEIGDRLIVGAPIEKLKKFHLIDLPGTNSGILAHEQKVKEYLNEADVVLFCSSATQALKNSEMELIKRFVDYGYKMLFVLTKSDLLSKGELSEVKTYVEVETQKLFSKRLEVLPVSIKWSDSIEKLQDYIEKTTETLEGKSLSEYRTMKDLNYIYNLLKTYKERLTSLYEETKVYLEKCEAMKKQLEERWKSIQEEVDRAEKRMGEHIRAISLIYVLTYALQNMLTYALQRIWPFGKAKEGEKLTEHVEKAYAEFKERIEREVDELTRKTNYYLKDLNLKQAQTHIFDSGSAFLESKRFVGMLKNLTILNYGIFLFSLLFLVLLLSQSIPRVIFLIFLLTKPGEALKQILAYVLSIMIFLAPALLLKSNRLPLLYLRKHMKDVKISLQSFVDTLISPLQRLCQELESKRVLLEKAVRELNEVREGVLREVERG